MKNQNLHAPAYPPQIAQDNYGQIVCPVPGFTKLEAATLQIFCAHLTGKTTITEDETNEMIAFCKLQAYEILKECEAQKKIDSETPPATVLQMP